MSVSTAQGDPRKYQTYLETRPKSFEAKAVRMLIDVLRTSLDQPMKPGFVLLIVHLANADLLKEIKQAQDEGRQTISGSVCTAQKEANTGQHAVMPCISYRCLHSLVSRRSAPAHLVYMYTVMLS